MLLCSDIHTLFDQRRLAIVPKGGRWVVHVLAGLGLPDEDEDDDDDEVWS